MRKSIAAIGLGLLIGSNCTSEAATFYVSTTGSDAAPGTVSAPLRTIQKAAIAAVAGDVVIVAPGNYGELVETKKSGTVDSPIRFQGSPGTISAGFYISHGFIIIDGFKLDAAAPANACVIFTTSANDVVLTNNVFADTPTGKGQVGMVHGDWGNRPSKITIRNNQFVNGKYFALSLQGRGHLVEGNYFSSQHGGDAIYLNSSYTTLRANIFENWSRPAGSTLHTDLIQGFGSNGEIAHQNVIENNFAKNCVGTQIGNVENQGGRDPGVQDWIWRNNVWANVEAAMNMSAPGMQFYHNVFYRSGRNTGAPILFRTGSYGNNGHRGRVYNNIFVECGSNPANVGQGWYSVDTGILDFKADNNLVLGASSAPTKVGFVRNGNESKGINGVNPMFNDIGLLDFRVLSTSPCVAAGTNLGDLAQFDFEEARRTVSWTIGAYNTPVQVAASSSTPPMPSGFTVEIVR